MKVYRAIVKEVPKKAKWYHGWIDPDSDLRGQVVIVAEHSNRFFPECLAYSPSGQIVSSSLFIFKEHLDIIEEVGEKTMTGTVKYHN